jgi:hypothetical protein
MLARAEERTGVALFAFPSAGRCCRVRRPVMDRSSRPVWCDQCDELIPTGDVVTFRGLQLHPDCVVELLPARSIARPFVEAIVNAAPRPRDPRALIAAICMEVAT